MLFLSNSPLVGAVQRSLALAFRFYDLGAYHPVRAMRKRALEESVNYMLENMHHAIGFVSPRSLLKHAVGEASKVSGHFCEFGVFKGASLKYIARLAGGGRMVHGFDSFEGIPSVWAGHGSDKGAYSAKGKLPAVPSNACLHVGWFEQSIPRWRAQYDGPIALMHLDADLYESTKTVFDLLGDRLQPGSIIVFDEYFNYPFWREHEFRAFQEFVRARTIQYKYISYSRCQVAVRIDAVGSSCTQA